MTSISENVATIRARMNAAALAVGRKPEEIILCAATKMNDTQAVRQAIAAGVDCCGENRVQELRQKMQENAYQGVPVHFIGHLQTNKVRQVVGKVDLIQSVDSLRLLEAINREAAHQGICQDILMEVNVGQEESKSGFLVEEIHQVLEKAAFFSSIRVCGLMAIPPISRNPGDNSKFFAEIYNLSVDITRKKYDNVRMGLLSMGMSDDFADAIACGSNMIRVGSAIFGPRNYAKSHHQNKDASNQEDIEK